MTSSFTERLYEVHHRDSRVPGFSILKDERGRLIAEAIGTKKTVLDIGCRDGALTGYFSSCNDVTGADIDRSALKKAAADLKIKTVFMDLYGDWSELAGATFDAIVCGEVLEHLFLPDNILDKIRGHLKAEGLFIGSVPNAFSLRNRLRYLAGSKRHTPLSDPTHVNHFSAGEIRNLLSARFNEIKIIGLGRHSFLASLFPGMFAFDLMFIARGVK